MKKIFQIYYDDETYSKILPGFIPLDNSENARPDWFEFWVILNYLRKNSLDEGVWYGFLSPKFREKTGLDSKTIYESLDRCVDGCEVFLFSPGWDQLSYFLNPFEQGDLWHPGLKKATQIFLDHIGLSINLSTLVTDSHTSVFSNYIIAKKNYWDRWKILAELFFEFVEKNVSFQFATTYGCASNYAPMKTFIQERLATLILSQGGITAATLETGFSGRLFTRLFVDDSRSRKLLLTCDLMKRFYRETSEAKYLEMYWEVRSHITLKSPNS